MYVRQEIASRKTVLPKSQVEGIVNLTENTFRKSENAVRGLRVERSQ